ncbi:MAG TPA: hypothetical protein VME63_05095 [Dyella sp.]|uniref:hypothetical protein n=1 Tax=Dyella sp. TaxID=1869338 RepID=UPI002CF0CE6B|nr:hypothetical protein [Dyella sp.]HTV84756.1 hypothetical protein [Dyella sp.]
MFRIDTDVLTHFEPTVEPHPGRPNPEESAQMRSSSVSITPGPAGFPSSPASGRSSGLLARFDHPTHEPMAVRVPGDSTPYYIKDASNTRQAQPLFTRDPDAKTLKQTSKQAVYHGDGDAQPVNGLIGGRGYSPEERAARLAQARRQLDQAVDRLDAAQASIDDLKIDLRISQADVTASQNDVNHADTNVALSLQAVNRWEGLHRQAMDNLTGASNQLAATRERSRLDDAEVVSAQHEVADAKRKLSDATRIGIPDEVARRTEALATAANRLSNAGKRQRLTHDRYDHARQQLDSAQAQHHDAESRLFQARQKLSKSQTDLAQRRQELCNAKMRIPRVQNKLTSARHTFAQARRDVMRREAELKNAEPW